MDIKIGVLYLKVILNKKYFTQTVYYLLFIFMRDLISGIVWSEINVFPSFYFYDIGRMWVSDCS